MPYPATVSIIFPVHRPQFFHEALSSILSQTHKAIEVLIVDNSQLPSDTKEIERLSSLDPRVNYYRSETPGAGAARNLGLCKARGEFIMFLDSDDVFDPAFVEEMVAAAISTKSDIVVCGWHRFFMNSDEISSTWMPGFPSGTYKHAEILASLYTSFNAAPWNKIFRRDFLMIVGCEFQNTPHANDQYFVFYSLARAATVSIITKDLIAYRIGNTTSTQQKRRSNASVADAVTSALYRSISPLLSNPSETAALEAHLWALIFAELDTLALSTEIVAHNDIQAFSALFQQQLDRFPRTPSRRLPRTLRLKLHFSRIFGVRGYVFAARLIYRTAKIIGYR